MQSTMASTSLRILKGLGLDEVERAEGDVCDVTHVIRHTSHVTRHTSPKAQLRPVEQSRESVS